MSNLKRTNSKITSKIQEALDNLNDFEVQAIKEKYSIKTLNPFKKRSNNKKMLEEVEALLNKREIERKREELRLKAEKRREAFSNNIKNIKAHFGNHSRLYAAIAAVALVLFSGLSIFSKIQSTVKDINFTFSDEEKFVGDYVDVSYIVEPDTAKYDESDIAVVFNNNDLISFDETDNKYNCIKEGKLQVKLLYKDKEFDSKTITISPVLVNRLYLPDITLGRGNSQVINPTIEPSNATNKNYTAFVDDTNIAIIDNDKLVGVSVGNTVLHLISYDGFSYDVNVDVIEIEPESININGLTNTLVVGDIIKAYIKYMPEETTLKNITWTSSNNNVLSVDQEGNVIAKEKGTAIITAHYSNNVESKQEITVKYPSPSSIEITNSNTSMYVGNKIQLYASISPKKVSDNSITWTSSDTDIATVNENGVLVAKSEGTVTIYAKTANNKKDYIEFTIKKAPVVSKSTANTNTSGNSSGTMVWIPKTGSKFHTNPNCSNMKNPTQVTLEQAREWNYQPCGTCAKDY